MTTLATASGSLFVAKPAGYGAGAPLEAGGYFRPLWTSGDQTDAYGLHTDSAWTISYEGIYCSFPAPFAVVNKIVRQISTIPLKVYRVDQNGEKQRIRADSTEQGSSLAMLLERPSPRRGAKDLKQWISLPALVAGNSLLAKWRGDGQDQPPTELMRVDWRYVNAYAPPGGDVEIWGTTQLGGERFLAVDDTLHFAWDATAGSIGLSPLKPLADTLKLENAAVRTQVSTFKNGTKPTGFVVPGDVGQVTPHNLKEMREQVEAMHGGPDQAGKIAALAPGGRWLPLIFDSHQAELLASRIFNRVDVCAAYDTKPPVIGYVEAANFASVKEFNQDFYRTTLRPWLVLIEETIQAQLIDPEPAWQGLTVEFDMREQLKGSPLEEAERMKMEFEAGVATVNENRAVANKPRSADPKADEPFVAANNVAPLSSIGQAQLSLPGTSPA